MAMFKLRAGGEGRGEEGQRAKVLVRFALKILLNPTPTDFRGPIDFICYRMNSVAANKGNKRKQIKGTKNKQLLQAEFR